MENAQSEAPVPCSPEELLSRWKENAAAWTYAVRAQQIESRRVCTDAAVVSAVVACRPECVLDVGCGEGWLVRELNARGFRALGIDPIESLVRAAELMGGGPYRLAGTRELFAIPEASQCDVWVCNFSLFHPSDAQALVAAASDRLRRDGALVVQTLHESAAVVRPAGSDDQGWQPGSWQGCSGEFGRPIPWFFRSRSSWESLLRMYGFDDISIQEPIHPVTGKPLSLLLTARQSP